MNEPVWDFHLEEHPYNERTLAETLIGGQSFRWFREPNDGYWIGIWGGHVACLRLGDSNCLDVAILTRHTSLDDVHHYLGYDRLPDLIGRLPCQSDPVLADLRDRWQGLSLLRQPPGETLLAFICSSNKQILQIRAMLKALSQRFGTAIKGTPFKTLPTWPQLADIPEAGLRACSLGYRAAHVAGTARFLADRPGYLDRICSLSLPEARTALQALPGVGPKVADCVLLFGFGFMEAFPVDTWIARLLVGRYPALAGWPREQLATFARLHFGPAAGLAQQWFFADRVLSATQPKLDARLTDSRISE